MGIYLQKAGLWKRIAAWLLDAILVCVLAAGCAWVLSFLLNYDAYSNTLQDAYAHYEKEYGVTFNIDQETYDKMTDLERKNYDAAYNALIADQPAMQAYNMLLTLSILIISVGVLIAMVILEYIVPLLLRNGSTLGKKLFSLGVVRTDGVKINNMQLFVRAFVAKYTIETMLPIYLVMLILWGALGITGTAILAILAIAQVLCYCFTSTNSVIHDLMAGTVVVDISSQRIFESTEALLEYNKRIHAERAARQDY